MKVKKALFLIAGILRVVASGIGILFSLVAFMASGLIRSILYSSGDLIEEIIKSAGDVEDNTGLLEYSHEELIDYVMNVAIVFFVILLVVSIVWLIYGIINIRLGSGGRFRRLTKGKGILLCVCGWLLAFELITNIMITIAVCIKNPDSGDVLYTQANSNNTIEVK